MALSFGFSNIAWPESLDDAALDYLQHSGITFLDAVPARTFGPDLLRDHKRALTRLKEIIDRGMKIRAFQSLLYTKPHLNIFHADDETELIEYFNNLFELAAFCETKFLVFGSPKNRLKGNIPLPVAMESAALLFRALGDLAQSYAVSLCIEPNARQYGCDFLNTVDETAGFIRMVDHPNICLHLDSGNMLMENEDWSSLIEKYSAISPHFHLSAPMLGTIDELEKQVLQEIVRLIPRFYRQFSIEMLTRGAPEERLSQIQNCLELVKACGQNDGFK